MSMDSFQQALQNDGKFFFKYKIIFELASYMPEKKFQRDSVASILIESHGFNVSCCVSFRVELQVL